MTDFITKRSGQKVKFDKTKLEKWAEWAANKNVDWQPILESALQRCPNGVTTKDFHKALIDTCVDSLDYDKLKMAARLLVGQLYKDVFSSFDKPSLQDFYSKMVNKGLWESMKYSKEELAALDSVINHEKDLNYSYTTIRQVIDKYLIKDKNTKQIYETPQFLFMGMALATMKDMPASRKLKDVEKLYNYLSDLKINAPTPLCNSLRTHFKSYASCTLFTTLDTADSIEAGVNLAYSFTTAQAGIGGYLNTRSIDDPVNNGRTVHQGKLPYYKFYDAAVRSTKQGERSGALTMYYSCLDPELETLLKLKNVKTPDQKRINFIDYGFQCNKFFWEQVSKKEKWMLVSSYYAPYLYELFFSSKTEEFKSEYFRVLNEQSIPKVIVEALDIAKDFLIQRQETGRVYPWWVDTSNNHTPFNDTIYSSNLCSETMLPTKGAVSSEYLYEYSDYSGETAMCNLSALVLGLIEENEYEDVAYYTTLMVDRSVEEMNYPFESVAYTAKARRSLGIGLTNLAYDMAKNGYSYSSLKGKEYIHKLAERHSYYLHKASLRLAKEFGNAEWMYKTKYPKGWLPIDTAKDLSFTGVNQNLHYDWETLRKEIMEQGGIRNSVLEAHMPCESSSQLSNATNGLYPIRELVVIKKSGNNTNVFFAPDYDNVFTRLGYESAYDIQPKDLLEVYAVVQKFTGQGISADMYLDLSKENDKMSLNEWLQLMLYSTKLGLKSLYYMNTRTDRDTSFDVSDTSCEACKM